MKKKIIQPKYVDLAWLKGQGFAFPKLIEYHGMKKLVEMKGTYYSDLVRVFYTTAHIDGEFGFCEWRLRGSKL